MSQEKTPAKKPPAKKKAAPEEPKLSKYENFEMLEVDRETLLKAPYNPRKIKKENKQRLRERIERVGLLAPIVWNKKTGNVVSGHQRLDVMDTLSKSKKYRLTVAVVDLEPEVEKEQNMFFNNPSAQGEWDLDGLADMWDESVNMINAGFSKADMETLFDADPAEVFAETLEAEDIPSPIRKTRAVEQGDAPLDESEDRAPDDSGYFSQGDKVREGMQHRKRRAAVSGMREDNEFFFVAVFKSVAERDSFLADYGIEEAQFINGNILKEAIEGNGDFE